eukprot:TRINITY_DN26903_c0_g1_i1.p1 TRINITY_DN26903_c0_g1~~TRINITY_DN26903_c0_g1_i1.p1  ORF type:complete len:196 (+),score=91.38 TRINITY_DN26903_c0_g1_i1:44-631(+)
MMALKALLLIVVFCCVFSTITCNVASEGNDLSAEERSNGTNGDATVMYTAPSDEVECVDGECTRNTASVTEGEEEKKEGDAQSEGEQEDEEKRKEKKALKKKIKKDKKDKKPKKEKKEKKRAEGETEEGKKAKKDKKEKKDKKKRREEESASLSATPVPVEEVYPVPGSSFTPSSTPEPLQASLNPASDENIISA